MIKVIHIISGLKQGGAEVALMRLMERFSEYEYYEMQVISLGSLGKIGEQIQSAGLQVTCLNISGVHNLLPGFFKLYKILRNEKPHVVQTWMYHADLFGGIAAKMASIENIFWGIHTFKLSWKTNAKTIVVRTILALLSYLIPKKIITVSAKSMGYHTRIGYCADKFVVIANGFDFRSIKQEDMPKFKLRKRYNLPRDARLIGTVGRFHHDKNYDMLIDVARIAVEEVPSLFFVLIGQGLDYSNKHLLEKIKRYKMANNFLLLGARDDAIECMSQFDVFCLTSNYFSK